MRGQTIKSNLSRKVETNSSNILRKINRDLINSFHFDIRDPVLWYLQILIMAWEYNDSYTIYILNDYEELSLIQ